MEPWPDESTKRSRSGQRGSAASNFRNLVNSTVATSAMPIGMPGWPDLACSTASIDSARKAFAMRRSLGFLAAGKGASLMAAEYSALSIENVPPAEALHRADGHGETIARYRTPAQPRRRSLGFGSPGVSRNGPENRHPARFARFERPKPVAART